MKSLRAWFVRVLGVFGSTRSERDLSAEIESHLQLHADDNVRAGMSPAEARRRAVIALGSVEGTKEAYRDRRGLPAVESLVRDLRYGVRSLLKTPGFALAGVVILGLGIGVNSAIFTVVNAVVLRPLPIASCGCGTRRRRDCSRRRSSRCRRPTSSIGKHNPTCLNRWRSTMAA